MTDLTQGPYLAAAVFCQQVLQEKDRVLSLIRVVDILNVPLPANFVPTKEHGVAFDVTGLLAFKSGSFVGEKTVSVTMVSPSGNETPAGRNFTAIFKGGGHGFNIILAFTLQTHEEGLYWFHVVMDGQIVARMPLQIIFERDEDAQKESENQQNT